MFDKLSDRLQKSIKSLSGNAVITEKNIDEMVREIRLALLEADVNYKVVQEFTKRVKEQALGEEVIKNVKPSEMLVSIVDKELTALLGETTSELIVRDGLTTLMMVGLQGTGKTTAVGKLGYYLKNNLQKKVLFVAADVYRLAAIDQLRKLAHDLEIDLYEEGIDSDPVVIAKNAQAYAKEHHYDYLLVDTAGRLYIDEELMEELSSMKEAINPDEIMLIVDAMSGQDGVNVALNFNERLSVTGAIITKLDGDSRGGVALSLRHVSHIPIKFSGIGEHAKDLAIFHPDRMSQRILGMGDVVTLVEKAQAVIDEDEAENLMKRMQSGKFDLTDLLTSMRQTKKMGSLKSIMKLLPGMPDVSNVNIDERELVKTEALILSMTKYERENPDVLKASRKKRIADGSGLTVTDLNRLLKQFEQQKKMMKMFSGGSMESMFQNPTANMSGGNRQMRRKNRKKKKR